MIASYISIAACLATGVFADFHLMYGVYTYSGEKEYEYLTCPSNYYNRQCWCDGDRMGVPYPSSVEEQDNGEWKLRVEKVCGVAEMDFWWRPNGINGDERVRWEAYIPNADGRAVATCFDNGAQPVEGEDCWLWFAPRRNHVTDGWVCYSEICGHA
ncbi:hypothetical protein Q7P37_006856 [Cladosporium fusiforme]